MGWEEVCRISCDAPGCDAGLFYAEWFELPAGWTMTKARGYKETFCKAHSEMAT